MKIAELPGQVPREVTIEKELRPDGQTDTCIPVSQVSHVSWDNE